MCTKSGLCNCIQRNVNYFNNDVILWKEILLQKWNPRNHSIVRANEFTQYSYQHLTLFI